jgi:hypothetical protein
MATREVVYREFGKAAEIAQLLETELGTALLALDALETKSFLRPGADAYLRLRDAIDKQTLGHSIKQIRKRLSLTEDLGGLFQRALETRNLLTHRFYPQHGLAILDVEGRKKMVIHLVESQAELNRAYLAAQHFSELLVNAVKLLKKVHH